METNSRRDFFKKCAFAACLCGFGSFFRMDAEEKTPVESVADRLPEVERNEAFALHWITELLDSLKESGLNDDELRAIVKNTSRAHHDLLNVPEMVRPYIGKPEEFIDFLRTSWGWKVTDNKQERTLHIDESKPFCVCPLLKNSPGCIFPALCYCSEGFAEQMFSYVYRYPIKATVAASVQRGDPSCIYIIKY